MSVTLNGALIVALPLPALPRFGKFWGICMLAAYAVDATRAIIESVISPMNTVILLFKSALHLAYVLYLNFYKGFVFVIL